MRRAYAALTQVVQTAATLVRRVGSAWLVIWVRPRCAARSVNGERFAPGRISWVPVQASSTRVDLLGGGPERLLSKVAARKPPLGRRAADGARAGNLTPTCSQGRCPGRQCARAFGEPPEAVVSIFFVGYFDPFNRLRFAGSPETATSGLGRLIDNRDAAGMRLEPLEPPKTG